ncbi:integrase core domain-containing protein [Actinomadura coerulea]|uniref:integrase core domain-containing protein n=1 Tax=Actinomadura coerulea TaxID=46159 RepID=UPI00341F18AD
MSRRLTRPHSLTTTGKSKGSTRPFCRELLDDHSRSLTLSTRREAIDAFVAEYNHDRPHRTLDMHRPADRFRPRHDERLPTLHAIDAGRPRTGPYLNLNPSRAGAGRAVCGRYRWLVMSANGIDPVNLAMEFTRVVPASGNLVVCRKQFWLGTQLGRSHDHVAGRQTAPASPTASSIRWESRHLRRLPAS